jgi:LysM repeat protein
MFSPLLLALLPLAQATPGEVTLPLDTLQQLRRRPTPPPPPAIPLMKPRTLTGEIRDGLLSARLTVPVQVHTPLDLSLLPPEATVGDAVLDGQPAPLRLAGGVAVPLNPGEHLLQVDVLEGRTTDRFERRVSLDLPDGSSVRFDLWLPEAPVDVTLARGVLTSVVRQGDQTRVQGWLPASAALDLAWERRTTHEATDARTDTEAYAILDVGGDLVVGQARYTTEVLAGQLDRTSLQLPAGVEVTQVTGPEVLQWHVAADRLHVLLRKVVDTRVQLDVGYQYPAPLDEAVALRMPVPEGPMSGALGLTAPVATTVTLEQWDSAAELAPRDMPQGLVELSADPLRAAMALSEAPEATVRTSRTGEVLTSASRIDDLQGISLLMEDGTEVGKLRLAVRNADRQALTVTLPEGARLTHCFRDGVPLRPAADPADPDRVLVPLSRSARAARRTYTVQPGDTLSGIASMAYGDANRWQDVQLANQLASSSLSIGQQLVLPTVGDADTESFTLELGWERHTPSLASFGQRSVALPQLDLEVMDANWHVYLPEHLVPLTIDANLVQRSGLRGSPVTRALDALVHSGITGSAAYAGDAYKSALDVRRSSYFSSQQQQVVEPLSAWPLVGQRIRFSGQLLGTEAPRATVRYVGEQVASATRTVAWALALCLAVAWARRPRHPLTLGAVAVGGLAIGVVGHFLVGTWGLVLQAVLLGLAGALAPVLWAARRRPSVGEVVFVAASLPPLALALLITPRGVGLLATLLLATAAVRRWGTR